MSNKSGAALRGKKLAAVAFLLCLLAGNANGETMIESNDTRITVGDSVAAVVNHPAFNGFGKLLLPWNDGRNDMGLPLSGIGRLMPYHRHVVPSIVVDALNRMIDDAKDGRKIFFDFYTLAQKQDDPAKKTTGLFYFRGAPGAPFAVICPGGGFSYVGALHEGFPIATEISRKGYNAFVIRYRTGGERRATEDLAAAVSYIAANAKILEAGIGDYSVWGGSAGARIAANIGAHGLAHFGGADLPRPAAAIIAYTGHGDYSGNDPPTFAIVGEDDGIAPPAVMERRVKALRSAGVETEFRVVENTGHGFGLGKGTKAEGWLDDAIRFWKKHMRKKR